LSVKYKLSGTVDLNCGRCANENSNLIKAS